MMEWAAWHAKERNYAFWRAFTTGKPLDMGGIPHDRFGMTTRSVHRYVLGNDNLELIHIILYITLFFFLPLKYTLSHTLAPCTNHSRIT